MRWWDFISISVVLSIASNLHSERWCSQSWGLKRHSSPLLTFTDTPPSVCFWQSYYGENTASLCKRLSRLENKLLDYQIPVSNYTPGQKSLRHLTKYQLATHYLEVGSHFSIFRVPLTLKQFWNSESTWVGGRGRWTKCRRQKCKAFQDLSPGLKIIFRGSYKVVQCLPGQKQLLRLSPQCRPQQVEETQCRQFLNKEIQRN